MSCSINGTTITMTRGDTLRALVNIERDGVEYTPEEGDAVRFALKSTRMRSAGKQFYDSEPLILKDIPIDTMLLELAPEDTKPLGFGTYAYDIQITFADGTVDTFIPEAVLKLTPEVE